MNMNMRFRASIVATLLVSPAGLVLAQSAQPLPVPAVGAEFDVPGAHELPDPGLTYKVVFDVAAGAPAVGDMNPGLVAAARFVNTLAKHGVPADHRQVAVVLHRDATEASLGNAAFQARHDGHDNPNIALIRNMKKAGMDIRQCGQALVGRKIDPQAVLPEVQVDFWALTTLLKLQFEGYVRVGG
jgi:intracellular sulfur oxidation DsrE/DsrF family protein